MKLVINPNGSSTKYDITGAVEKVTWEGDKSSCCREVSFSLVSSPVNQKIAPVPCELMDNVFLYEGNELLFTGKIWSRTKESNATKIEVTAFDRGFYLNGIEAWYQFKKKKPAEIVKTVCKDYGISCGSIANPDVPITRNFFGISLYKIIQTAYTLASKKTGTQYQVVFKGEKLYVENRGKVTEDYVLAPESNLMDVSVTESAENMVTRVKIYSGENKFVRNVDDADAIKEYGILQRCIQQSADDNMTDEAKDILKENKLSQKITVNSLGDIRCRTGGTVYVEESYTGVKATFYIDADVHTWKNGQYSNRMTLNLDNVMDKVTAGSEKSEVAAASTGGGLSMARQATTATSEADRVIQSVLKYAASHVGDKYDQSNRMGTSTFDCSSFVYRAFQSAGVKLRHYENGCEVNTAAYEYHADGFDRYGYVKGFAFQPGDLVFYSFKKNGRPYNISHVAIVYDSSHIVHARNPGKGVTYDAITYGRNYIVGILRYTGEKRKTFNG